MNHMIGRGILLRVMVMLFTIHYSLFTASAQQKEKFSPEKFQADLEQFITKEAGLTAEESVKFFPLYREMQNKQRAVWNQMRDIGRNKPADEASCRKAVEKRDELELEQQRILQTYHKKFFQVIPASKVYDVIRAENQFHRRAIREWRRQNHQGQQNQPENKKHQPRK